MERLYFAYGSNMSSPRLRARVGGARPLGVARLADHALAFDKRGRDGTGKANVVGSPGRWTWGVVWSLSGPALDDLDRFEPGYRRMECPVHLTFGRVRTASTYLRIGAPSDLAPAAWYVQHILAGAREHRLPAHWCALLEEALRGARASRR